MPRLTLPRIVALWLALASAGCTNYADQLARAEHHYQNARYEAALANLEDLEIYTPALSPVEQVRYAYVRGMAHLRLDQHADARHWLALARERARSAPGVLTDEMRTSMDRTIAELDPLAPHRPAASAPGSAPASATP